MLFFYEQCSQDAGAEFGQGPAGVGGGGGAGSSSGGGGGGGGAAGNGGSLPGDSEGSEGSGAPGAAGMRKRARADGMQSSGSEHSKVRGVCVLPCKSSHEWCCCNCFFTSLFCLMEMVDRRNTAKRMLDLDLEPLQSKGFAKGGPMMLWS
jgi:hypothetical protein